MFLDVLVVDRYVGCGAPDRTEAVRAAAEQVLRDWAVEHAAYYAVHGASHSPDRIYGFLPFPGGGRWLRRGLSAHDNYHAIAIGDGGLRMTYEGRRDGMRPEFAGLLRLAHDVGAWQVLRYSTREPDWLPWESRRTRRAAEVTA